MGGAPSLDSEMKEMKDKTATFLAEFVKQYTIFTAAGILKKQEEDAKIMGERSKYELKWVPEKPEHPDRLSGYIERRTTILKKWKKIYAVVRGNWLVEYWATEEDFKAGKKPENSINLSGTYLYRDPYKEMLEKLEKFCAKAKIDISDIPKPEQLPEFTIKMQDWSERRPELLFKCANEEEYNKWKKMLDNARYYVDDLSIDDDVHRYAFPRALSRARWASGCWGYSWGGGGEYQYLTDSIVDAIEDAVMPSVDNKLYDAKMPYFLRSRVRKSFVSTCNSFVSGGVKPAWDAAWAAAQKVRPDLKEQVEKLGTPLNEQKAKLKGDISSKVAEKAKEVFQSEGVKPHLDPFLDAVFEVLSGGFYLLPTLFDKVIADIKGDWKPSENRCGLVRSQGWWGVRDAYYKMWDLYDPLWLLNQVFDCSPWTVIYRAQKLVEDLFRNALYTFEFLVAEEGLDKAAAAAKTRQMLVNDSVTGFLYTVTKVLTGLLERTWEKLVIAPARELVRPLADAIPDAMKTFLDPIDLLNDVLEDVLFQLGSALTEPLAPKMKELLAKGVPMQ
jgi:hypothetical protein